MRPPTSTRRKGWASRCIGLAAALAAGFAPAEAQDSVAGLLQFLDGALMRGSLLGIDPQRGVRWQHPAAAAPIEFNSRNLHQLRIERTPTLPTLPAPGCRVVFLNGDVVLGQLVALDAEQVVLQTWFAGRLTAPRASLKSVTFLSGPHGMFYDGPTGLDGWTVSAQNQFFIIQGGPGGAKQVPVQQPPWRYQEGAFVAESVGFIGRDLKLPDTARLEFDLAWQGPLAVMLNLYTDAIDRFDYSRGAYQLNLGSGYANLMRIQGNAGMMHLGMAQLPATSLKNRVRLEIRASREQGSLTLLADGVQVQHWRDPAGFAGQGTGISFYSQRPGSGLRVSAIRVSAWDGRAESPDEVVTNLTSHLVKLANKDRLDGTVQSVSDGVLAVKTAAADLNIPLARVMELVLAGDDALRPARAAGSVQVHLPTGERLTLASPKWDQAVATGVSPSLGAITFNTAWVRLLEFNPGKPVGPADDLDFFGAEVVR
jgi:hypothetical protein